MIVNRNSNSTKQKIIYHSSYEPNLQMCKMQNQQQDPKTYYTNIQLYLQTLETSYYNLFNHFYDTNIYIYAFAPSEINQFVRYLSTNP